MGKNLYFHLYLFFIHFFSIEFFEGVSRGGLYRWSMDPVRWTGPQTGGQCFRVTHRKLMNKASKLYSNHFQTETRCLVLLETEELTLSGN